MDKGLMSSAKRIIIITIAVVTEFSTGQVLVTCHLISLRGVGIIIPISQMRKWRSREEK